MQGIIFRPDVWKAQLRVLEEYGEAQTRRLSGLKEINQAPDRWILAPRDPLYSAYGWVFDSAERRCFIRPRYRVGEVLYIKEAWLTDKLYDYLKPSDIPQGGRTVGIWYWSGGNHYADKLANAVGKARSSLFMPAWAARHFIKIKDVGAERLQEISDFDAIAEGITQFNDLEPPRRGFKELWDILNPKYPWSTNPWLWRYVFELTEAPK